MLDWELNAFIYKYLSTYLTYLYNESTVSDCEPSKSINMDVLMTHVNMMMLVLYFEIFGTYLDPKNRLQLPWPLFQHRDVKTFFLSNQNR